MQELFKNTNNGQDRLSVKMNTTAASWRQDHAQKKQKLDTGWSQADAVESRSMKRPLEHPEQGEKRARQMNDGACADAEVAPMRVNSNTTEDTEMEIASAHRDTGLHTDNEMNLMERMFQDDMKWTLNQVEDMCDGENPELHRTVADFSYYDENTWEELDPKEVQKGAREEYDRS